MYVSIDDSRDWLMSFLQKFTMCEYLEVSGYSKNSHMIGKISEISIQYDSQYAERDTIIKIKLSDFTYAIIQLYQDKDSVYCFKGVSNKDGNTITREINSFVDLVDFLSVYKEKESFFSQLKKKKHPSKRFNKIYLSRHLLKHISLCNEISYSESGITFNYQKGGGFYAKFQLNENGECLVNFHFSDSELSRFNRKPPENYAPNDKIKLDVKTGTYSRGAPSIYSESFLINGNYESDLLENAGNKINELFKTAFVIKEKNREKIISQYS